MVILMVVDSIELNMALRLGWSGTLLLVHRYRLVHLTARYSNVPALRVGPMSEELRTANCLRTYDSNDTHTGSLRHGTFYMRI